MIENSIPWITVCHPNFCRVMTNGDPEGQVFLSHPHTDERSVSVVEGLIQDRGYGFEPHWRQCVVSFSKTLYPLLSTCSTQEEQSRQD